MTFLSKVLLFLLTLCDLSFGAQVAQNSENKKLMRRAKPASKKAKGQTKMSHLPWPLDQVVQGLIGPDQQAQRTSPDPAPAQDAAGPTGPASTPGMRQSALQVAKEKTALGNCLGKALSSEPCIVTMDACPSVTTHNALSSSCVGCTCAHMHTQPQDRAVAATATGTVCCNSTLVIGATSNTTIGYGVPLDETTECYGGTGHTNDVPQTYAEAEQFCVTRGHQLCTAEDVYSGRACGVGCNMDCFRIWTRTPAVCRQTDLSINQGAICHNGTHNMTDITTATECCNDIGIIRNYTWKFNTV